MNSSTIYAPASATGRAGVAVYRVSGPQARLVFTQLARLEAMPEPRRATLRRLYHPVGGELIDYALLLWFKGPDSFTGEDVAEIHAHGGKAVAAALLDALAQLPDYRLAAPGEFSRRAFDHGKLDLTEAEAIADLVAAETEAQRKQALRQMQGGLKDLYTGWRQRLATALAYLEASIDFADEDLPQDVAQRHLAGVAALADEISGYLNDNRRGERLRDGFTVAILGAPNAGKSSLLNALARRNAAIVSSIPGTTRDVVEVHLDLGGYPVTLLDTAGLRDSTDAIEAEGIRRALARAASADLKLLLFDGERWPALDTATLALMDADALVVINKSDIIPLPLREGLGEGGLRNIAVGSCLISPLPNPPLKGEGTISPLFLSAQTGNGIPALLTHVTDRIATRCESHATPPPTRERHRAALTDCVAHLRRGLTVGEQALQAEDLRLALRALGSITGAVGVEDLLDIIFRDFCIGK